MPVNLLKRVPIFASLDEDELDKIGDMSSEANYSKNDAIFLESDSGDSLFILKRGKVKISKTSEDGKEVIFAILKDGDFFGEMSLFDGQSRSATVTALADSNVYIIRREDFMKLIENDPKISISILREMTGRLRKADSQIKRMSLLKAKDRVASTLLQLVDLDECFQKKEVEIRNLPSQKDLAKMAGTSREMISRSIKNFINDGLIKKDGDTLVILDFDSFLEKYI
ncbi:Crp/Fnr family transcriptional regulator [candidate division KSB1 bacterium]